MPPRKSEAAAASDTTPRIVDGEWAVKLTKDIQGGIGNHKEGTVIRNLSFSAFNTLVQGGFAQRLNAGDDATDAVDATNPLATPATAPQPVADEPEPPAE
jgi:hypothetical protein